MESISIPFDVNLFLKVSYRTQVYNRENGGSLSSLSVVKSVNQPSHCLDMLTQIKNRGKLQIHNNIHKSANVTEKNILHA